MGSSGTRKNKDDNNISTNIDYMKKKQELSSIEKEGVFKNMVNYLTFENLKIIEKQKKNSICQIINPNKVTGTGFLSLIPYPDKLNQLPVLLISLIIHNYYYFKKTINIKIKELKNKRTIKKL